MNGFAISGGSDVHVREILPELYLHLGHLRLLPVNQHYILGLQPRDKIVGLVVVGVGREGDKLDPGSDVHFPPVRHLKSVGLAPQIVGQRPLHAITGENHPVLAVKGPLLEKVARRAILQHPGGSHNHTRSSSQRCLCDSSLIREVLHKLQIPRIFTVIGFVLHILGAHVSVCFKNSHAFVGHRREVIHRHLVEIGVICPILVQDQ
mmetsp:Transcript_29282/g.62453  ORF Transcript_29282/g.62453 Transcript_29282/m.62453 type:complete len:206 (-) Transcript_29282:775-1392(-)